MFTPLNFPFVAVNNSLFFCTYGKYLGRVPVLFFRDIIDYEDSQCLFPCCFFFPAMTQLLQQ